MIRLAIGATEERGYVGSFLICVHPCLSVAIMPLVFASKLLGQNGLAIRRVHLRLDPRVRFRKPRI